MSRGKQFTLSERINIQTCLDKGLTFTETANETGLKRSSISKEVKLRKSNVKIGRCGGNHNNCSLYDECRITSLCQVCEKVTSSNPNPKCRTCLKCNDKCYSFKEAECELLKKAPHVCNGCKNRKRCRYTKILYDAHQADKNKNEEYRESHKGFYITEEELNYMDEIISKPIKNGQSIHVALVNHKDEILCSEKTIYNYINAGAMSIKRMDLVRAVRYRERKKGIKEHKVDKSCRIHRTMDDFTKFMNGSLCYVEGDTVEGKKGGKCLTTLIFKQFNLQLSFIKEHNTSAETIKVFDFLYETLGRELYMKLFYVLLLDNGTEFSNPSAIEFDKDGNRRSYVFYCDPKHSEQKGTCEKNHEEIRKIIPKGVSMDNYSQDDINFMMSHINSYLRKKLNDISPYDAFSLVYGNDILPKLGITRVSPDDVILKPSLLNKK